MQLYAVGYGHINTVQSVFVADQFEEEVISQHNITMQLLNVIIPASRSPRDDPSHGTTSAVTWGRWVVSLASLCSDSLLGL